MGKTTRRRKGKTKDQRQWCRRNAQERGEDHRGYNERDREWLMGNITNKTTVKTIYPGPGA